MDCAVRPRLPLVLSLVGFLACSQDSATEPGSQGVAGTAATPPSAAGASAAGTSAGSGATAQGAAGASGTRSGSIAGAGASGASGSAGSAAGGVAQSSAGTSAAAAGIGGAASEAGAAGTAGGAAGTPGSSAGGAPAAGAGGAGAPAGDLTELAKGLNGLFLDAPCTTNTPTPLARMATCMHAPNTQHIDKPVTFGGEAGKTYVVTLRVRGIWEPTKIQGGTRADMKIPFTVGGMVPPGSASSDAINYQQYSINVASPKQVYWLNDHQYVAHDIHKLDYQAKIEVSGGSMVTVTMHDGNDHEIANWTMDFFEGLPPYDQKPSSGQMLRLDVMSVTLK